VGVGGALTRLADATAEAVVAAARELVGDAAQAGPVIRVAPGGESLRDVVAPALTTSVTYDDAVAGGSVFVVPVRAARALAAAKMQAAAADEGADGLSEAELTAAVEAMEPLVLAAAAATSLALGAELESSTRTRLLTSVDGALDGHDTAAHVTSITFTLFGESCRLLQLVPNAFVMRMTQAFDELRAEYVADPAPGAAGATPGLDGSLRAVKVRVWAELGRRPMPIGALAGTPAGAVLELDRQADDPVDLYVNGLRFATGRLVVSDGGEWAVRIDELVGDGPAR
jgi:flagellar motor switch protein FliN